MAVCQYDAQIQAENAAITQLQNQRQAISDDPTMPQAVKNRMFKTYDAQIKARQDAVAVLEAECAE